MGDPENDSKKRRGGNICCFPHCNTTSRKDKGVGLFKPTNLKGEYYKNWNKEVYNIILRYRVEDKKFKELREKRKIYVCEKHYVKGDIEFTLTGKKTVKLGALPTLNLPPKSHEVPHVSRKPPTAREVKSDEGTEHQFYKTFDTLCKSVSKLKLDEWTFDEKSDETGKTLIFRHKTPYELINRYELVIDISMGFSVFVYDWPLPDDHEIYKSKRRSLLNARAKEVLTQIYKYAICKGLGRDFEGTKEHIIQHENKAKDEEQRGFKGEKYFRTDDCHLLSPEAVCHTCTKFLKSASDKEEKVKEINSKPVHPNTPLTTVTSERLIASLKNERLKNKQLREYIQRSGITLDSKIDSDIFNIFESNQKSLSPFVKLFWEEQKKCFQSSPTGRRYHPMLIRLALSIATKSPAAYEELRTTGVLMLPSMRTLRDYRNFIQPKTGFNPAVIEDLIDQTSKLKEAQRFVCLSLDEMKIQSDLVFNKSTGELVGFTDLGEPDINAGTLKYHDDLATHVLVFYLRGIKSDLKYSFAYFATKGLLAFQLFPIFWRAVNILEIRCKLPIIAVVCDGASSNRNFFRLHKKMSGTEPVYKVKNIFAPERCIYFLSDVPHLMKTLRNCLWHSKPNGSRYMWNNGQTLEWAHICRIVDMQFMGLKGAPKLTRQHVNLNSYTIMNVRLAVQTLSSSVATVLREYYDPATHGTAEFCDKTNTFFDILNIRCSKEAIFKRKGDMLPFKSVDDPRLEWLEKQFLGYFEQWKDSIDSREGFTQKEKVKMFISAQTYEGIQITVKSIIEIIKFCLQNGFDFVLTERFMQDVLEQYFGLHRSMGGRSENPSVYRFGYDENSARLHRSLVPVKGNTAGAFVGRRKPYFHDVDDTPLKKRSKNDLCR